MFTGIINHSGVVDAFEKLAAGARLRLRTTDAEPFRRGESLAVNGVCLTVLPDGDSLITDVSNETLSRTTLGTLLSGAAVNVERALAVGDRLGGHIVQGHVDGVGSVVSVEEDGFARRVRVELPPKLLRYVIDKGSITLSGVSLTVAELGDSWAEVSLIPETLERTNLGEAAPGDRINVECDVVAKYVERLVAPFAGKEQA